MLIGSDICHFGNEMGKVIQAAELLFGQALIAHLQLQVCYDRDEVSIATTFTHAIYGPLHLDCTFAHRGERVNNRTF